jgi:hypothetical protein
MNEYDFAGCENIFTNKCSGEVKNLLGVAERYGILTEKVRGRIESLCRQCKSCSLKTAPNGSAQTHRKRGKRPALR